MQPQSQSQTLKVCNSCKRTLHVRCFGIARKSKDGFNVCCKECRNYRRRKDYHGKATSETDILPLNENNRSIIVASLAASPKVDIPCLRIATNESLTFRIEKLEGAYQFAIFNGALNDRDTFLTGFTDLFVEIAINLLRKRGLRLFHPYEPHSMLDWQYGPSNSLGTQIQLPK